jgi:hypothetical protein
VRRWIRALAWLSVPVMDTRFIPLAVLAERTGVPESWLRELARSGRLPMLRRGRRKLFDAEASDRALSAMASNSDAHTRSEREANDADA